jgi:hypothetical protein
MIDFDDEVFLAVEMHRSTKWPVSTKLALLLEISFKFKNEVFMVYFVLRSKLLKL